MKTGFKKSTFSLIAIGLIYFGFSTFESAAQTAIQSGTNQSSPAVQQIADWTQWRGPQRTGIVESAAWPNSLKESNLKKLWSVPLGPSYSSPIVVGDRVFTTETKDKKFEVVTAFDRQTGNKIWSQQWDGAMDVMWIAKANGSWIRATPVFDDGKLYVAGMRDVLVCLNAEDGETVWKLDFPATLKTELPSFGFVCSPLVDGDFLYVQAGGAFCKLKKSTGEIVWRVLENADPNYGSAFSSPIITTVAGQRMGVVQTRESLCGVDLETGETLWSQAVPSFRGMNIITPTPFNDNFFNSTYGGVTQLISVSKSSDQFSTSQTWKLPAEGYMGSPIIVDNHAYIHLKNQRFACYDLVNGVEKWRSKPYGKYASLIANGNKILALNDRGQLLLLAANPEKFELVDSRSVGDDTWAHLAVRGNQIFVRDLSELVAFEWEQ